MNRCKYSVILFIGWIVWAVSPSAVHAQSFEEAENPPVESCFVYYDYGKLKPNLGAKKGQYKPGENAEILGTIVNENTFPVQNVTLYGQLKRVNTATYKQNGHYLVDRIVLLENLNFLPQEEKSVTVTIPILPSYPNGSYQLHYFLFSEEGFHYSGRPFLEEDMAGVTLFEIVGGNEPMAYFDINTVKVNNQPHTIREPITSFPPGTLTFQVSLVNSSQQTNSFSIRTRIYAYEDEFEKNVVHEETNLASALTTTWNTSFAPSQPGAYLLVVQTDQPQKSYLRYRFAVEGNTSPGLRINDLGVTDFPPSETDRAYVCFHSLTPQNTAPSTITLTLLDEKKQNVDQLSVTREFDGSVKAISLPLEKIPNLNDFWVKTSVTQNSGIVAQQEELHFSCDVFQSSIATITAVSSKDGIRFTAQNVCGGKIKQEKEGETGQQITGTEEEPTTTQLTQKPEDQNEVRIGGTYIELIRILQSDGTKEVVKEYANVDVLSDTIAFDDLPPGNYTAEITSAAPNGRETKVLSFSIPRKKDGSLLSSLKSSPPYRWGVTIGILILILVYFYIRRKIKREKTKQQNGEKEPDRGKQNEGNAQNKKSATENTQEKATP